MQYHENMYTTVGVHMCTCYALCNGLRRFINHVSSDMYYKSHYTMQHKPAA